MHHDHRSSGQLTVIVGTARGATVIASDALHAM
jgi:hypothetical protein